MLTADLAKIVFAELKDYSAKAAIVQMRATVIGTKAKMRHAVGAHTFFNAFAVALLKRKIKICCVAVYIDFPTDAATVLATVGDTGKFLIIFRCVYLHKSSEFTAFF
jgi:hypothetical protein